jgi:2-oxoglutarate dehydrogenase E2 component (dihydrolipoamide succinyltransferase)
MAFEVRIPALGESVTEGTIVRWVRRDGETVRVDEALLELETDKAGLEIAAERAGVLRILKPEGATVTVGEVVARIEEAAGAAAAAPARPAPGPVAEPNLEAASEQDVVAPSRRPLSVRRPARRPRRSRPRARRRSPWAASGDASPSGWFWRSTPPPSSPPSTRST